MLAEHSCFFIFPQDSMPCQSADMSQLGVALFSTFQTLFCHFTFLGFAFIQLSAYVLTYCPTGSLL